MSSWELKRLGDICQTGAGGTPLKSQKHYYEGGEIPWLLSGEVNQRDISKATNFITEEGIRSSSAKVFPRNTVLVAMYGATAGAVGILRFDAATNQAVCGILPNDRVSPEFLYYYFLATKEELVAQAVGGAQPNISQIKIKNVQIPLPAPNEQKQIIEKLDQAFLAIDKATKNAEKNLKNTRELVKRYLNSVFSRRGPGWKEETIPDICIDFGRGKSRHRPRNEPSLYGGPYPFIQTGDLSSAHHVIRSFRQTYNEKGLEQSKLWPKVLGAIEVVRPQSRFPGR